MTNDTGEQIKFWAVLVAVMLGVSVAVLLIDMTIKAAILEESNALRRTLLGMQDDRQTEASSNGTGHDASHPGPVLDKFSARMEAGNVANGSKAVDSKAPTRKTRGTRARPGTESDSGEIPPRV